ncbi:MAG: hypothetical protein ACI8UP_005322 [Porticoccaceae bacterium]|jgi:hypothetical protein
MRRESRGNTKRLLSDETKHTGAAYGIPTLSEKLVYVPTTGKISLLL